MFVVSVGQNKLLNLSVNLIDVELVTYVCIFPQSELDEAVHRLELENAKLEAALRHESSKVESLQRERAESTQVGPTKIG